MKISLETLRVHSWIYNITDLIKKKKKRGNFELTVTYLVNNNIGFLFSDAKRSVEKGRKSIIKGFSQRTKSCQNNIDTTSSVLPLPAVGGGVHIY